MDQCRSRIDNIRHLEDEIKKEAGIENIVSDDTEVQSKNIDCS